MERLSARLADVLGPPTDDEKLEDLVPKAFAATRNQRTYWQILARVMLDGESVERLQGEYPVVPRIVAAVRRSGLGESEGIAPEIVAAVMVATGLGVLTFEPYLRVAVPLDAAKLRSLEALIPMAIKLLLER